MTDEQIKYLVITREGWYSNISPFTSKWTTRFEFNRYITDQTTGTQDPSWYFWTENPEGLERALKRGESVLEWARITK